LNKVFTFIKIGVLSLHQQRKRRNEMKECTIVEVNGMFQIGEITDEFISRIDYEAMALEYGIKLYRTDGNTPKWADKLVDKFNATFVRNNDFSLDYAYVYKLYNGEVAFCGLVSPR